MRRAAYVVQPVILGGGITPIDIGGGHILDVRRPQVTKFLFEFMGQPLDKAQNDKEIQSQRYGS